jgi:hypothetical protein
MVEPVRMTETPRPLRSRTLLAGLVLHDGPAFTADCTVRNLSEGGANIRLASFAVLGRPTILLVPRLDSAHEAQVAWPCVRRPSRG